MVKIKVDGIELEAKEGSLLIDVLLDKGFYIPHFCYHKALGFDGNCRMCLVDIKKWHTTPHISCNVVVTDGMEVYTDTPALRENRKNMLELEFVNHPIDCPICDQAGECDLQKYYMDFGLYDSELDVNKKRAKKHFDIGANVILDQERCVLCKRCVRFTSDITKTGELSVFQRGGKSVVDIFEGNELNSKYAMNVVDLCPVGALTSSDFRFKKRVWFLDSFKSICNACSKGCNIWVDHHKDKYSDDIIYRFRPRYNKDINGHFICDYGRLSYKIQAKNRLLTPLYDNKKITLNQAIGKLLHLLKNYKGRATFLLSPNLSLEDMDSIKGVSEKFNSFISGYSDNYFDDSFADNWLRQKDISSNRRSFERLAINCSKNELYENLKNANLVLIFENNYFLENLSLFSGKEIVLFSPFNFSNIELPKLAIPTPSHSEKSGSYINCDGILQRVDGAIDKNYKSYTIPALLAKMLNSYKHIKELAE